MTAAASEQQGGIALFVPSEAVDDGPGRQAGDCSKTPAAPRIDRLRPGPRLEAVACLARNRGFESISLQQRVCCELGFGK
jgi:hypothetical protein